MDTRISVRGGLAAICLAACLLCGAASAKGDPHFDVLRTKTGTYTNVTVLSCEDEYIFIAYGRSLRNVSLKELSPSDLLSLGYAAPRAAVVVTNQAVAGQDVTPTNTGPHLISPQAAAQMKASLAKYSSAVTLSVSDSKAVRSLRSFIGRLGKEHAILALMLGVLVAWHLFFSFCCLLICQKSRAPSSLLVWLPILQYLPLMRAASMSYWWVLALFIPVLNLVGYVLWCIRIVRAREKNLLLSVFLLLPITNFLAFVYLAFSGSSSRVVTAPRKFQSMALRTA